MGDSDRSFTRLINSDSPLAFLALRAQLALTLLSRTPALNVINCSPFLLPLFFPYSVEGVEFRDQQRSQL
jgi:hypothetical protein